MWSTKYRNKMAEKNIAAVLHGPKDIRLADVGMPEIGSNDVLLEIGSVGICGSDLKYWKYGKCGIFNLKQPMVMGHEASGTVVNVGKDVKQLKVGDRVAIEPGIPCRICRLCKTGRYNLCPDMQFCATPPVHGNLCQFFKHPADFCHRLPDQLSLDDGALIEPLSVAIYACHRGHISIGTTVLICGAGPVGILVLLVAKQMGSSEVIMTDVDKDRLSYARSVGANYTIEVKAEDPKEFATSVIEQVGFQPDTTIECSGTDFSLVAGIYATFPGGSIVLVGRGMCDTPIPYNVSASKECDIKGVFRYANCYPTAIRMISTGAINSKGLVTHRFDLTDTVRAFQTANDKTTKAIKLMIDCSKMKKT